MAYRITQDYTRTSVRVIPANLCGLHPFPPQRPSTDQSSHPNSPKKSRQASGYARSMRGVSFSTVSNSQMPCISLVILAVYYILEFQKIPHQLRHSTQRAIDNRIDEEENDSAEATRQAVASKVTNPSETAGIDDIDRDDGVLVHVQTETTTRISPRTQRLPIRSSCSHSRK